MAESGSKQFTNRTITIKLDESNFLAWKQQIELMITGHGLEAYVDGTPPPPEFITAADGSRISNPALIEYRQVDASLTSWILSSISSPLLSNLVNCRTARSIWLALQPKSSTTTVMRLISSLNSQKKCNLTMREYLSRIQNLCDSLASCSPEQKLTETMQIGMILGGLGSEYDSSITLISGSLVPYSLAAATNVLLDAELRLNDSFGVTALNTSGPRDSDLAQKGNSGSRPRMEREETYSSFPPQYQPPYNPQHHPPYNSQGSSGHGNPSRYSGNGQRGGYYSGNGQRGAYYPNRQFNQGQRQATYGRGQGRGYSSNRPQCQICGRLGHLAGRCWFRMDLTYGGIGSPSAHNGEMADGMSDGMFESDSGNVNSAEFHHSQQVPHQQVNLSSSNRSSSPSATSSDSQFFQIISPASHPHLYGPQANTVSATNAGPAAPSESASSSSTWYPDSGATHHLTNSVSNMAQSSSYNGAGPSNRGSASGGN